MAEIRNWKVVVVSRTEATEVSPEQPASISGNVYYHHDKTNYPDGKYIATSPIISHNGREFRTASGSLYTLVNPDADYADYYPDAESQVMAWPEGEPALTS